MDKDYSDMIHLPHHVSDKHPPMSRLNRAAQFAPFAALSGHEDNIRETGRLTEAKVEIGEDAGAVLDAKLQVLRDIEGKSVEVTFFVPDSKKAGGRYESAEIQVKRVDEVERVIRTKDGRVIPIDDILDVGGEPIDEVFGDR